MLASLLIIHTWVDIVALFMDLFKGCVPWRDEYTDDLRRLACILDILTLVLYQPSSDEVLKLNDGGEDRVTTRSFTFSSISGFKIIAVYQVVGAMAVISVATTE